MLQKTGSLSDQVEEFILFNPEDGAALHHDETARATVVRAVETAERFEYAQRVAWRGEFAHIGI